MKHPILKTTLALLAFLTLASFSPVPAPQTTASGETYVYICTGPKSKRYHKTSECKGLDNCSKDVKKVTLSYAQDIGRTPCKICYK